MYRPTVCTKGQAGHGGLQVAGVEFLVRLLIGKQRRQADVGGRGTVIVPVSYTHLDVYKRQTCDLLHVKQMLYQLS